MIGDRKYFMSKEINGSVRYPKLYAHSFGYTETRKKVSAGATTAVLAATAASTGALKTVTTGITQPDVPRCLTITPGGTSANILDSAVLVNGTNVNGMSMTESFQVPAGSTTLVTGLKAFKQVTSVVLPGAQGSGVTFAVGTSNKLGVNHALVPGQTTVKVFSDTTTGIATSTNTLVLQGVPTIVANEKYIELNNVSPLTAPDGTTFYTICYTYDNWLVNPVESIRGGIYFTSTSTSSTSSSTSTTTATTTSTSSTSSSTSSTSSSTSSTSQSTSSTSTSTTTAP